MLSTFLSVAHTPGLWRRAIARRAICSFDSNRAPVMESHGEFIAMMRGVGEKEGSVSMRAIDGCDQVVEIVMSNPSKRGAINSKMMLELGAHVDAINAASVSGSVRGVILRGAGKSFCAGLDLELARNVINSPQRGILMSDFMTDCLTRIRDSNAVSVCVINGPAVGGGSEIITCCDYRLVVKGARVQSVHARIGAAPGWGGTSRLLQLVGRKHALTCLGASASLDPSNALAMGLVDLIIEPEDDDESYSRAGVEFLRPFVGETQCASSVRGIKYTLAAAQDVDEMLKREQEVFFDRWFSAENVAAVDKALGKKK